MIMNLVIEDKLIREARELIGLNSINDIVEEALIIFVK
jgi:hypothetical protein